MKKTGNGATAKLEVLPPSPPSYKGKMALSKIGHVREELARLYREARTGKIDVQDATRLAYLLQVLAKVIETSDLEQRVEALERSRDNGKIEGPYSKS